MTTILTQTTEHTVAARDGLMSPVDAEKGRAGRSSRKACPRRALRALPASAVSRTRSTVAAFWRKLGGP